MLRSVVHTSGPPRRCNQSNWAGAGTSRVWAEAWVRAVNTPTQAPPPPAAAAAWRQGGAL